MEDTKSPSVVESMSVQDAANENGAIYIDPKDEKAALHKFDKFFVPVAFVFLVLSALDRSNVGNARVFGFDEDLGLKSGQFGNINTVFFATFIFFETPWVMAIKRFGPNKALGTMLLLWSCVTIGNAFIKNYAQAMICRVLLGAAEAGVSPGFAYLFATIYPPGSTAKRIMLGNLANTVSGAFGGLLAYGIQSMGDQRGIRAWRWLFIIEGCFTILIGGAAWFFLPTSPETAWFLNKKDQNIMALRKQRDALFRGGEEKFDKKWLRMAFTDPLMYMAGAGFFFSSVAITGFNVFLPTIIKGLGYASIHVNYMTIPIYVLGTISLVIQAIASDKLQKRCLFLVANAIPVIVGYLICVGTANKIAGYVAMFVLCLGVYSVSTILVCWVAINFMPDHKRSIALPFFYSMGNLSGLVSSQLFPTAHGPRYIIGMSTSCGLECVAVGFFIAIYFLLRRRNARKAKAEAEGATTNGYEDDRGLGFTYRL